MSEISAVSDIMKEYEVRSYFEIWRESVIRSRLTITAIFFKIADSSQTSSTDNSINQQITVFLQSKVRKTDLLFQLADGKHWGIFFLQSSNIEARAFLKRIFTILQAEKQYQQIIMHVFKEKPLKYYRTDNGSHSYLKV